MYVFSFIDVHDDHVNGVLEKYSKWFTSEEVYDDENIIERYYNFDDSTAMELHNDLGDTEIFGGFWPVF